MVAGKKKRILASVNSSSYGFGDVGFRVGSIKKTLPILICSSIFDV